MPVRGFFVVSWRQIAACRILDTRCRAAGRSDALNNRRDFRAMRTEEIEVTPEMAQKWLAAGAGMPQRALSTRRVSTFASAMARGQWRVTHQPIAIDPAGIPIDGQHRLNAVVVAKKTVRMSIAFDVPRDTFNVIDTGVARTTASSLHIAGIPDANAIAAAARNILVYREIQGTLRIPSSDVRGMFTTADVLEFIESRDGDVLRSNLGTARNIGTALAKYGARSWISAALTLIEIDGGSVSLRAEFADKWETGAMLAERTPLLGLRRWMTSEHGYVRAGQYRPFVGIGAALKAWNAWTTHQDLALIRIRPGAERWPVVGREDIDAANDAIPDDASELDTVSANA